MHEIWSLFDYIGCIKLFKWTEEHLEYFSFTFILSFWQYKAPEYTFINYVFYHNVLFLFHFSFRICKFFHVESLHMGMLCIWAKKHWLNAQLKWILIFICSEYPLLNFHIQIWLHFLLSWPLWELFVVKIIVSKVFQ